VIKTMLSTQALTNYTFWDVPAPLLATKDSPQFSNYNHLQAYHTTRPIKADQLNSYCELLRGQKFTEHPPKDVFDCYYDTDELQLQTQSPGGMWLRHRQVGEDSKSTQWNLRICNTKVEADGMILFEDVKDEQQIIDKIWIVLKPACFKPQISKKQSALDIISEHLHPTIAFYFRRTTFTLESITINLDVMELRQGFFSFSVTISSNDLRTFQSAFRSYSPGGSDYALVIRSKVIEAVHERRKDLELHLIKSNIIPQASYFEGHKSGLPLGLHIDTQFKRPVHKEYENEDEEGDEEVST